MATHYHCLGLSSPSPEKEREDREGVSVSKTRNQMKNVFPEMTGKGVENAEQGKSMQAVCRSFGWKHRKVVVVSLETINQFNPDSSP